MLAVVSQHTDSLLVVADGRSGDLVEIAGAEADAPADRECQHGRMRPHRVEKTQALDYAATGAGGFGLGDPVDVDAHGGYKYLA